jgi:hypothetical protein
MSQKQERHFRIVMTSQSRVLTAERFPFVPATWTNPGPPFPKSVGEIRLKAIYRPESTLTSRGIRGRPGPGRRLVSPAIAGRGVRTESDRVRTQLE